MAKYINSKSLMLAMSIMGAAVAPMALSSCDDEVSVPEPSIRYVRPIAAASSDSLLTQAWLGSTVAIIGDNLQSVDSVYFNDQRAKFSPTFAQDNNIILSVPTGIPADVSNKLYYYYDGGKVKEMDFKASVPGPLVEKVNRKTLHEDGMVYFEGNYFIDSKLVPLECVFAPGVKGEIDWEQSDMERLAVKVPEGAVDGEVKFTTVFGTSSCKFLRTEVVYSGKQAVTWNTDFRGPEIGDAYQVRFTFDADPKGWMGLQFIHKDWAGDAYAGQFDFGEGNGNPKPEGTDTYVGVIPASYLSATIGQEYYIVGGCSNPGGINITKIELLY